MTDVDGIVLKHLRHIRGAIDDMLDGLRETKQHIGDRENQCATMSNRLDRMDLRIERRLDLQDA